MNCIRTHIISFAMLLMCATSSAQMKWNQSYQTYINQYKDLAIEQMLRYRIPASITLAQGLFESRAGQSDLVRQGNNHFGIKCHNWTGPTQYHDDDARGECFRVYQDAKESYEDHSRFWPSNLVIHVFSVSTPQITKDGLMDLSRAVMPLIPNMPTNSFKS